MYEAETITELIDPALKLCGWGEPVNAEKSDLFDVLEYLYVKRAA
ncbi:MAG: hypothetical protein PF690_00950 [Deltaproteobacteria bacterium]|jgi:hypothetical protein|nr:hypothetical protein [Deltaproteobacteria bacterium]